MIHLALMGGPTFFSLVVVFLVTSDQTEPTGSEVLTYLSPALFFIALAIHPILFASAVKETKDSEVALSKKLAAFQTGNIMRIAVLEAAAIFAAVTAFLTGNLYHLITVGLVLAIMFTKLPTPQLLETELELSPEEKTQLSG